MNSKKLNAMYSFILENYFLGSIIGPLENSVDCGETDEEITNAKAELKRIVEMGYGFFYYENCTNILYLFKPEWINKKNRKPIFETIRKAGLMASEEAIKQIDMNLIK